LRRCASGGVRLIGVDFSVLILFTHLEIFLLMEE